MSPLRGWMQAHGRPSWYSWVVVVLVPLVASIGVLVVSLRVNSNAIDRERRANSDAINRERQVRIESQRAFCGIVVLLDETWRRTPPTTAAGRELADAVAAARVVNRCPPRT